MVVITERKEREGRESPSPGELGMLHMYRRWEKGGGLTPDNGVIIGNRLVRFKEIKGPEELIRLIHNVDRHNEG